MENGLSYDFGIQIASGVIEGLVQAVAGAAAITGTVYALISASEELDNTVRKNQIAFGGYVNTMKAIEFSADKLASGKSFFDTKDIMSGMRSLQAAGLDARKNFDLINKAADASGMSFKEMSDNVRSGNWKGLADAGIITDRTAISFQHAGMNAQMATKSVMGFIEAANKKGMFDNTVVSLSSILARFKEFGKQFVLSILGDPKDPNGFMFNVKATLTSMADSFYKVLDKIKAVGTAIGHVLLFVWHVVGDFIKRIWGSVKSLFDISDKTFDKFQQKMMSFQLWLEILRVKINSFFTDHEKAIKNILKIGLLLWGLNFFGKMLIAGADLIVTLRAVGGGMNMLTRFAPGLSVIWKIITLIGQALWGFITVLPEILAFFIEFLIPILAIAAAVYLVIHYWNEIYAVIKFIVKVIWTVVPILHLIQLVVKVIRDNWDKIVALVKSVFNFFVAIGNFLKTVIVHYIKEFFNWIEKGVSSLGKMLMSFKVVRIIVEAVKDAFAFIGNIWDKISKGFGKVLDWAKGVVDSGTNSINAKTAEIQAGDAKTPVGKGSTAGTPTPAPAKSSAAQKVSYTPDITTTESSSGVKTMNINSGAVQINVGKDSGLDELKLAAMIKKILLELNQKGQIRQGQVG